MRYVELRQPIDIERLLIWTYRDQKADRVLAGGFLHRQEEAMDSETHFGTSSDGVATMERIGRLGTRVDGGGPSTTALHPDAEIIHHAVMALPRIDAILVVRHARAASRPDHAAIVPSRPVRQTTPNGRVKLAYAEWDRSHNYGWCPISWTAEPVTSATVTAEYALWWGTLRRLALALSRDCRMIHHRAQAPKAPTKPKLRHAAA